MNSKWFEKFTAYWDGYVAAQMGKPIDSNPEIYDPEFGIWENGWLRGKFLKGLDSGPLAPYNIENPNQRPTEGGEL